MDYVDRVGFCWSWNGFVKILLLLLIRFYILGEYMFLKTSIDLIDEVLGRLVYGHRLVLYF
ncbi:hypothetical protein [Candidatus Hodgkinia cicadicola]|uniref:hypothetical protein n=1 Tax=Candidatus Hodgkinia cicadicola TaxID=573658 RepID=UPI0011BAA57A